MASSRWQTLALQGYLQHRSVPKTGRSSWESLGDFFSDSVCYCLLLLCPTACRSANLQKCRIQFIWKIIRSIGVRKHCFLEESTALQAHADLLVDSVMPLNIVVVFQQCKQ